MYAWWQVALAAELSGTMDAAFEMTLDHVKRRFQFGKPLIAQQTVQHQLAECKVAIEGSRWLARRAAFEGGDPEFAAAAAAYASRAAGMVLMSTHQLTGALGITDEFTLTVWTMRLQALRLELGGAAAHAQALARARYVIRASAASPANATSVQTAVVPTPAGVASTVSGASGWPLPGSR
jgi:alkylation response protein AidB-like acyl-CoA dehydrogenase